MGGRTDGCTNGCTNGWMDGSKPHAILLNDKHNSVKLRTGQRYPQSPEL